MKISKEIGLAEFAAMLVSVALFSLHLFNALVADASLLVRGCRCKHKVQIGNRSSKQIDGFQIVAKGFSEPPILVEEGGFGSNAIYAKSDKSLVWEPGDRPLTWIAKVPEIFAKSYVAFQFVKDREFEELSVEYRGSAPVQIFELDRGPRVNILDFVQSEQETLGPTIVTTIIALLFLFRGRTRQPLPASA